MNYYGQHTNVINEGGYRPATSWLNGQQVAGPDWNQMAAQHWSAKQQALRETPEEEEDLLLSQLRRQYNPPVTQPGYASFTENGQQRFMIGGQDVTNDLAEQALRSQWGGQPQTVEDLAQRKYAEARKAAAMQMTDRLMGREKASLDSISPLLMDPRVRGLDPGAIGGLVKNIYGRGLDEYAQAQRLSDSYGQPMTWADIENLEAQQKNQAKTIALLNAYGSMMGARGEMGRIVGSEYDDKVGGIAWTDEDENPRVVKMPREEHDMVKRKFHSVFSGVRQQGQQPATGTPAPKQLLAKSGGVKLRAPDGSIAVVRPEAVPRYTALGAVVIE